MAFGTLLLLHPDGSRVTLSLEKTTVRVGRAVDNDVVLALPQVADYHAQLLCDATGIQVLDLGSQIGTAIDDQQLEHYGLAPFRFGQRLQIGPIWMLLHHETTPSSTPEPPRAGWSWRPGWWERWRDQVRMRRTGAWAGPDNVSAAARDGALGQDRAPQAAPTSASTSAPATADGHAPSPGLVERARSWHTPEWLKRIFIWNWLKQNGHRTLSWVLDLLGFFWLRSFLSRWFGISPDMLNPMQLLDDKEPTPHHRSGAAPDPTLVRSEPQRGSPPTPPTIPVRRSEELHLAIEPTELIADPGRTVALTVTVVNRSPLVDRVCFLVDGLPETWISITPPTLSLMPGDSGSSEIVIRPPRDASSVAGTHRFVVAARSSESAEPETAVAAALAIAPFHDFRLDVQPQHRTAWRDGHYELRIINNSNQTQLFALQGRDEAQALRFDFLPAQPLIAPGLVAPVQVTVRRRRPHLIGKPITSPFHLLVEPAHRGEPAQQAQGRLTQRALSWSLLLLLLLLPVLAYSLPFAPYALQVAEAMIKKEPIPTPSRELFPPIPTGLPQLPALWPSSATSQPSSASPAPATPGVAAAQGRSPTPAAGSENASGAGTTLLEALGVLLGNPTVPVGPPDGQTAGEAPLNTAGPGPASANGLPMPATNQLPAFDEPILLAEALTEGQTGTPGYTVAELLAGLGDRAQSGGPRGLAVVGVAGGKWQYTADGVLWRDFPPQTSPANATLLLGNAASRIRFVLGEDFNTEMLEPSAVPQIQVLAWNGTQFQNAATGVDTGAGSAAGVFGATAATVLQRVTPVNDQPSFTLNLPTLVLTSTTRLVIAGAATDVRAGPANERHQKLSYDIAVDPLCLEAAISDNGALTLSPRNNVLCAEQAGTVVLRDNGGTDNGGAERSDPRTFTYTVDTRKQPPAWQNPRASMDILPEDPLSNNGLSVSEAILRLGYYDQQGGAGGLAVIGADNANGQWQYRIDGSDWRNMTAVSRLTPQLLPASAANHVRFVPSPDYVDDAVLTVLPWNSRSWDAAAAFWAHPALLHQAVRPVNDPPSFQLTQKTILGHDTEMVTIGLFASAISPGPENEAGQQVEFAIELSGDVSSVFASQPKISRSGTLTFRAQPNQKIDVLASVSLRDSEQGVSAPATFMIKIDTLSSTMTAAANATGTAAVQTAAAQQIAAPAQTQTAQAMLTTVARTETAANRTATAAAISYAATSYAATSYAATSYAATSYAYGTAAASATAIAATATRQRQETAIAATANAQTQAAIAAATSSAAAATAQAQATANAIAAATAIAQPQSLRISSPGRVEAGKTMDVEVVVLDGRGEPVGANGLSISLRLVDYEGREHASISPVASASGKATFTGLIFTKSGQYYLYANSDGLNQDRSYLTITPAPAVRFRFICFIPGVQGACQTSPPVFSTDQQFGFFADAVDQFDNVDTNFSQPSLIRINYGANGWQTLWGTPAFKQGYLSFNTTDLPSQKVGTDFFYEFGAAYTGPAKIESPRFRVIPGAPAVIIAQSANTITLGSSSTYVSSVLVMDSRQNPVQPGVRVCFKTNSPGSFDPDLLFSNTPGRYAMIMMSTDESGIATAPQATSNGRPGSYTLYAYTRPDGGCDPALDLSAPPGPPYLSVPFLITNE